MEPTPHHVTSAILEAAFDDAFTTPPQQFLQTDATDKRAATEVPVVVPSTAAAIGGSEVDSTLSYDDDSWKKEYDAQVRIWRAHHAEQREKAEKERLRWEAIRDQEKEEAKRRKAAGFTDEPTSLTTQGESWEQTGASSTTGASTAAAASQIFGPTGNFVSAGQRPQQKPSHEESTTDELQKWEDVPSMASSFPSLSFDTPPAPAPAPPAEPPAHKGPVSVTLSIFDSSLSTRTRALAFASSLAVNLLLPFVNGVMLGFGEIFAKNIVMEWLGWKGPASTVTNVGLRNSARH